MGNRQFSPCRWPALLGLALLASLFLSPLLPAAQKARVRIIKVLPHYLDLEGRHMIHPSLFDRDAYQFELRQNPELRSGLRFDVLWKSRSRSPGALALKLELRGSLAPTQKPIIVNVRSVAWGGFSQWISIPVTGESYASLGDLLAWRVTLWRGDQMVAEQKSFLW
jgi:hypothetical protein